MFTNLPFMCFVPPERARNLFIDLAFMSGPRPTSSAPWVNSLKALLIPDPPCEPRLACYKEMRDSGDFSQDVSLFLITREIRHLVRSAGVLRPCDLAASYEDIFRKQGEADLANAFVRDPEAFVRQYEAGWRALYRSLSNCEEPEIPQSCVDEVVGRIMQCIRIPRGGFGPYVVARANGDNLVIFVYPPPSTSPNGDQEPAPMLMELDRLCGIFAPFGYMSWLTVACGRPRRMCKLRAKSTDRRSNSDYRGNCTRAGSHHLRTDLPATPERLIHPSDLSQLTSTRHGLLGRRSQTPRRGHCCRGFCLFPVTGSTLSGRPVQGTKTHDCR